METTDHDHLGKLITSAAVLEARWAVLVAKEFRPEHRSALTWLNSISGEGSALFGIEVHAVRIAESPAAVQLDMVVKPDDFSRRARAEAKTMSEAAGRYTDWWAEFLPEFHAAHPGWSYAKAPSYANWLHFPSGKGGVSDGLSFTYPTGAPNYSLKAYVQMDDGESVYPALEAQRAAIEATCWSQPQMGTERKHTLVTNRGLPRPCRSRRPRQMAAVSYLGHRKGSANYAEPFRHRSATLHNSHSRDRVDAAQKTKVSTRSPHTDPYRQ